MVKSRYSKSPFDYERYSVLAVTSLYGVDIMPDNAVECRQRLFDIWNKEYSANVKDQASEQCREAVRFIFHKNILCGDALTMLQADGSPIVFAEWSLVSGNQMKRRDFRLDVLLNENPDDQLYEAQMSLFGDSANSESNWMIDPETHNPVPKPIREYPLTDYRRVQDYE